MRAIALYGLVLIGAGLHTQDPVRTADFHLRGLTAADFPRVTKLANAVYAYEQIDPTKRTVTVANNASSALKRVYMQLDGQLK